MINLYTLMVIVYGMRLTFYASVRQCYGFKVTVYGTAPNMVTPYMVSHHVW